MLKLGETTHTHTQTHKHTRTQRATRQKKKPQPPLRRIDYTDFICGKKNGGKMKKKKRKK